ncbi:putative membrane protein, partial [Leptospira interrogans serovar Pyrogenes str. L0374]
IRKKFYYLTLSVGLWTLLIGLRQYFPLIFRPYASLIILSVILAPMYLSRVVNKLLDNTYIPSVMRIILEFILISYLIYSTIKLNIIHIIDLDKFTYYPLLAYHILIIYSIIWICESIFKLVKCLIKSEGMIRVRLSLMLFGITSAFLIIIPLVWILPFFEIYIGSYASIGTMICIIFWGIAILHYDAFQTRQEIFSGMYVPLLNRITLNPILKLYSILDPEEFEMRRLNANSILAKEVIDTAYQWFLKQTYHYKQLQEKLLSNMINI